MQLAKKTGIPSDWSKYKQHKGITKKQVGQAHWNYVNAIMNKSLEHGNNKPFWKYIKARHNDNIGVAAIKDNGILYHDSKTKAELLNHQFKSVFFTIDDDTDHLPTFQIGAGLYAVGRPVQKRNDKDGQIGTIQSLPLERGALFNRFFGEPAHGPPHVAGGASGPIGGCRDESRTDNPDLDLRHVFDRNNRKTDLI